MHHEENGRRRGGKDPLAKGLGWFSVGLGAAQLAAPQRVARLIGVRGDETHSTVMRVVGAREVASGVGILTRSRPAGWLWSRVAGDVIDLALLTAAETRRRERVRAAMAAVAGVTVPDLLESLRVSRNMAPTEEDEAGVHVRAAVTVKRTREEVYAFWRAFDNFPSFMAHLVSVRDLGSGRSQWVATGPRGTVEWEAETVQDVPDTTISWRSLPDADVQNEGSVRFVDAPRGQGTEVHVDLRYDPPAGGVGTIVAKLLGADPEQQVKDDLRRLKQLLETGEVVVSEGSPDGLSARRQARQKPASPISVEGAAR